MLKILQARLQQYVNRELPDVQVGLGKQRNQRSHCQHLLDHRKGKKNIYICFTNSAKTFDCVNHTMWKILQQMGIPDHLTSLLRNLYACQEATIRTGHGTTDWFKTGKGVSQGYILSPAYLTYMQSISWNARLDEAQVGIKIAGEISITSDTQWRRQWQPTPVLLPGKSYGQRSLIG